MGTGCCCTPAGGCCANEQDSKELLIQYYYLDLEVCNRCMGTDRNLEEAITRVAPVLAGSGIKLRLEKKRIEDEASAIACRFASSPTIRIGGLDLAEEVTESCCQDCGDLCGDAVDCRTWTWRGASYEQPPVEMIADGILRAAFRAPAADGGAPETPFVLPENLERFFRGVNRQG